MEGSGVGIAGCVVHVVGGWNVVAREGMFLVGCCSCMVTKYIRLYSNQMLY